MDIAAKETLESAFKAYTGTILFVSHDRYFIRQVAESVLIFENGTAMYYPFGYEHYVERKFRESLGVPMSVQMRAEEQALIAGMRAVPRAERHSLREISTDEAYFDWQLRLSREQLAAAENDVEALWGQLTTAREEWMASEAFWNESDAGGRGTEIDGVAVDGSAEADYDGAAGRGSAETDCDGAADHGTEIDGAVGAGSAELAGAGAASDAAYDRLLLLYNNALSIWQEQCLQWYDIYRASSEGV